MSATIAERRPAVAPKQTIATLSRMEAKRFARHPLFVLGVMLNVVVVVNTAAERSQDALGSGIFPALFVGVFGFVVAYRLTRSVSSTRDVLNSAPASVTIRTAALCISCLVPVVTGLAISLALFVAIRVWPPVDAALVGTSAPEQFALIVGHSTIACLGAPLLGVATGRWLPFAGAAALGVAALCALTFLSYGPMESGMDPNSFGASLLHVLPPFTFFFTTASDADIYGVLYPGSIWWYLGWQLSLCTLAAIAALLNGAAPVVRTRLIRAGAAAGIVAIAMLLLTASGGADDKLRFNQDGTTVVIDGPS